MAWALASAKRVTPLVKEAATQYSDALMDRWTVLHRRLLGGRMRHCRFISQLLRRPWLTRATIALVPRAPGIASPIVRALNTPFRDFSHRE